MRADLGETFYIVTAGYGFEDIASREHETIEEAREDYKERGGYCELYEVKRLA